MNTMIQLLPSALTPSGTGAESCGIRKLPSSWFRLRFYDGQGGQINVSIDDRTARALIALLEARNG